MNPYAQVKWQSCPDEDSPEKWVGCDVSRQFDLCIICFRATAGGTSRWSWLACDDCRAVNDSIGSRWGFRPFALGRHSLMNGIGVRGGAPPEVQEVQIDRLVGVRAKVMAACAIGADRSIRGWQASSTR